MTASLAQWLTTDRPASRAQARLVRLTLSARALLANPLALVGLAIVVFLLAMALIGPYLVGSPTEQVLANRLLPPSAAHWLGTDELGRDILARIVYGSKITVRIVLTVSLIVGPFGLMIGIVAGYFGGVVDSVVMRVVDIFTAFPFLVMVIGIIAILGPGLTSMYIALTLAGWTVYARIVRVEVRRLRARRSGRERV
mgnify:CR=1 FL=1